jgi:ketoreductase
LVPPLRAFAVIVKSVKEQQLAGKTTVVTGGGRGIGKAIARTFVLHGATTVICSRSQKDIDQTAGELGRDGGRVIARRLDVRKREMFPELADFVAKAVGKVDILVNNSGISGMTPMLAPDDELWFDIIDTNLNGMYLATRYLLPLIPEQGRIINISSVLGKFGVAGYSAYCASKHGVVGFTRALSAELAPKKITVNAICPGWVDTTMARQGIAEVSGQLGISEDEFWQGAMKRVPLRRFVETAEVAALALYLASPESSAMTGQALNICGGATTS